MTRNDAEEFSEFVRATGPRLHRAALLLTGDRHLAEDLTQTAYETDHTTRLDLLAALATLPPHDRAVLVLRYWEDRSVADTAVDLGLTETTARTRARRALERLRPLVGAEITERTLT